MHSCGMTRREMLTLTGAAGAAAMLGGAPLWASQPHSGQEPHPVSAQEALARLRAGNARFAGGQPKHTHEGRSWRTQLTVGQHPFATILGCSDSRVPTELVFDQGFGDLFVIRVAGNVIAPDVIGSIEYAALHLGTPLLVVLGHESCGAVTAALEAKAGKGSEPERIRALLQMIEPGIGEVDPKVPQQEQVRRAVEANVRWSLEQLRALPEARTLLSESQIHLAGGVYELQTGRVRWLD